MINQDVTDNKKRTRLAVLISTPSSILVAGVCFYMAFGADGYLPTPLFVVLMIGASGVGLSLGLLLANSAARRRAKLANEYWWQGYARALRDMSNKNNPPSGWSS